MDGTAAEVVGIGVAPRDISVLIDPLPPADTKGRAADFAESGGGPVPTALVTLARLGRLCVLGSVIYRPISKLSKGFRQRVGMAQALLHEPDVLIMDEPTAGLDPNQIAEVRNTLRKIAQEKTILLSTHILQEVQAMASRVILINEGRLVYDGPTDGLDPDHKGLEAAFHKLTAAAVA